MRRQKSIFQRVLASVLSFAIVFSGIPGGVFADAAPANDATKNTVESNIQELVTTPILDPVPTTTANGKVVTNK